VKFSGLRILDSDPNGFASTELGDILKSLMNWGPALSWRFRELEVIVKDESGLDVHALEASVQEGKGLVMSWIELTSFADELIDAWELVVVGSRSAHQPEGRFPYGGEIVIQRLDSSDWEVWANDPRVLEMVKDRFEVTERVEGDFL
jgi:hypothetical protein